MLNKKNISKKIEILILLIIFGMTIFVTPIYYQNKYKNDKNIYISPLTKHHHINSKSNLSIIIGDSNIVISAKMQSGDLKTRKPVYSPYFIERFKSEYLNSEDKILIEYILDLIEFQREQIENYEKKEINDNKESKMTVSKINNSNVEGIIEQIPKEKIYKQSLSDNNLNQNDNEKPKVILKVTFLQSIIKNTNFLFLFSIFTSCLGVIITHKVKNNKFVTMSDFFLIVITVSTCFTSGNHLFFTVPSFINEISTFDIAIFALGPIAVIWLSIKGIIDLLYPEISSLKEH